MDDSCVSSDDESSLDVELSQSDNSCSWSEVSDESLLNNNDFQGDLGDSLLQSE